MPRRSSTERRFFTTSDIAEYCEVSNDGVLKWIKAGQLSAFATPGGHYRISAEDFRTFLEQFGFPIEERFLSRPAAPRAVTLLVVDDEAVVRDVIARRLAGIDANWQIVLAADGYEAGIKIGSLEPDIVILDLVMPRIDGLSLCRSIRNNPVTCNIGIIAITAYPEPGNLSRAKEAGADVCLAKPLDLERLNIEVLRLVDRARARSATVATSNPKFGPYLENKHEQRVGPSLDDLPGTERGSRLRRKPRRQQAGR